MIYVWILCFLQLLTLTASQKGGQINVDNLSDGIKLSCPGNSKFETGEPNKQLGYRDENSGEYQCVSDSKHVTAKIFVKFRTCDNCIEMDMASIIGITIGDVVVTIIIGVGVYIVANPTRGTSVPPNRKRSDGYPPMSHTARGDANDHYQQLRQKSPKDLYGDLKTAR
ncbi:T-cell surface glycoprotein CD3 epsilon chain [Gouania willdenowi]|nr:T-cell surface glycoprotein CD3 gamma chain [Gouania willdenowi]